MTQDIILKVHCLAINLIEFPQITSVFKARFALLKPLGLQPDDHQVMGEDPEDNLMPLRGGGVGGQGRAEAAFVLAEAALCVPSLMVQGARELPPHGAPVKRFRPAPAGIAWIERDDTVPHPALLAAKAVVVLGIIARIGKRGVEGQEGSRLPHRWGEVGRVLTRPGAGNRAEDQVRMHMDNGGELGPGPLAVPRTSAAQAEVGADVPGLEPGGVHGGHRRSVDQAGIPRPPGDRGLGAAEGPPLSAPASSRCAA